MVYSTPRRMSKAKKTTFKPRRGRPGPHTLKKTFNRPKGDQNDLFLVKNAIWIIPSTAKKMARCKKNVALRHALLTFYLRKENIPIIKATYSKYYFRQNYVQMLRTPWLFLPSCRPGDKKDAGILGELFLLPNMRQFWGGTRYWKYRQTYINGASGAPYWAYMRLFKSLPLAVHTPSPLNTTQKASYKRALMWNDRALTATPKDAALYDESLLNPARHAKLWIKKYRYEKVYRGRFLLRDTPLIRKKRQLLNLPIRRYKLYQRLFKYGYRARDANSFFMQSKKSFFLSSVSNNSFSYEYIFADIARYKTWSTRRFWINSIYFRKLLWLYLGHGSKKGPNLLKKIATTRHFKLTNLYNCLQYSIFAVLQASFQVLGVKTLLTYITQGYVWVNGSRETNPFRPCYLLDFVQLDIFRLLRQIRTIEEHPAVWALPKKHLSHVTRRAVNRFFTYLPTALKTTLSLRPFAKKEPVKDYLRWSLSLYSMRVSVRERIHTYAIRLRQLRHLDVKGAQRTTRLRNWFFEKDLQSLVSVTSSADVYFARNPRLIVKWPAKKIWENTLVLRRRVAAERKISKRFYRYLRQRYRSMHLPVFLRGRSKDPLVGNETLYKNKGDLSRVVVDQQREVTKNPTTRGSIIHQNLENRYELPVQEQAMIPTAALVTKAVWQAPHLVTRLSRAYQAAERRKAREEKARFKKFTHPIAPGKFATRRVRRKIRGPHELPTSQRPLSGVLLRLKRLWRLEEPAKEPNHSRTRSARLHQHKKILSNPSEAVPVLRAAFAINNIETSNLRHSVLITALRKALRAKGRPLKNTIVVSSDIFASCVINKSKLRYGRRSYLNEANLRFLMSFK